MHFAGACRLICVFLCGILSPLCLDKFVALLEFCDDFLLRGDFLSHPGVADDINQVEALGGVELEHVCDQILEFFTKEALSLSLCVVFPEKVCAVCHDQLVVTVVYVCLVKWWVASV